MIDVEKIMKQILEVEMPTAQKSENAYVHIEQIGLGCISGRINEWPMLRVEAKEIIAELTRLRASLASAESRLAIAEKERDLLREAGQVTAMACFELANTEGLNSRQQEIVQEISDVARAAVAQIRSKP